MAYQSPETSTLQTDVMLILPPQWTPLGPYYALAILAGEIEQAGYSCTLRDLNIEFFHRVLSPEYLSWCRHSVEQRKRSLQTDFILGLANQGTSSLENDQNLYLELQGRCETAEAYWDTVIDNIHKAKQVLCDEETFYDAHALQWAFDILSKGLEIASLPHYPSKILVRDFQNRNHRMNLESVIAAVNNVDENPFIPFYTMAISSIEANPPKVIGLSINANSQLVPGLTLAKMLKESLPDTHITIGGNFFTRVIDTIQIHPEFFDMFCHSLMFGEGEKPFVQLIEQVKGGQDWQQISNLMYAENGQVTKNGECGLQKLNELSSPCLKGLDLSLYLSPKIVMPIQASRGCYWKKCTFCDHDFGQNFGIKSIDKLVAEIKHFRDTYGIHHFEFIDESISPSYLKRMSQAFIENELNIHFFMYARTEKGFSQEIIDLAKQAGCTMIMWGLESGSERIMNLINKGVPFDQRFEPLKMANNAGIWNFCFLFFGFPTETVDEAMKTIHMIVDHRDLIHSYGMSHFTLGKHTQIRFAPEKFGIVNIREDEDELSTGLKYDISEGMTREQLMKITQLCNEICDRAYRNPLWFSIGFREFLHLYLQHYGFEYVKQFSYATASHNAELI